MTFAELRRRVWYLFNRDRATRELEEEMQLHRALRAEHIATGDTRAAVDPNTLRDAHIAAHRRFGNTTVMQERSRDMWGFGSFDEVAGDMRYAVRRLTQQRAFSLGVIGVMAIGIGAVTAMFSAVDAALLRPLPFHRPEQLVRLSGIDVPFDPGAAQRDNHPRRLDMTDVAKMSSLFSSAAAYAAGGLNLADDEHPVRVKAGVVTANFFTTLGVTPALGRTFTAVEGAPDGPNVAIISHALWQRQFGSRSIDGLRITLGKRQYTVVGVMPERFTFPAESDVWIPLTVPSTFSTFDAFRGYLPTVVIARTAPGVSVDVASKGLTARLEQWRTTLGKPQLENYDTMLADVRETGAARALQSALVGDRSRALFVLLGATGLLLLVACVNVTNLLLSHASQRRRELAVRHVLGATRACIVRQLLTESLVLAACGGALGVLAAPLALGTMRTLLPESLASVAPATIDARVLVFATMLAVGTGIAFGLWPAFRSTRGSASEIIKGGGGHGSTTAGAGRARRLLVSAELALTVMLLVGAGLMLRSFEQLLREDNGMHTQGVGTLEMAIPSTSGGRAERVAKIDRVLERLASVPGIEAAAAVNDLPLNGAGGISVTVRIDGAPPPATLDDTPGARYLMATDNYFRAMGIILLAGRTFTAADDSLAPSVAIVSASMAKQYWPNGSALSRTFQLFDKPTTIIGVVSDVRERKLEAAGGPQMYLPLRATPPTTVAIVVRSSLLPSALLSQMQQTVQSVDKSQAVYNVRMMDDLVGVAVAPRRTNTMLIAAFALLALALAAVGVYAVVSYSVSQRTRELGIRAALGASGASLVRMFAREMAWVTAVGIAVGLAGAWALARVLESLVYGIDVHDALTFVLVPLAMLVPTALATYVPARRAWRVNPADVMRAD